MSGTSNDYYWPLAAVIFELLLCEMHSSCCMRLNNQFARISCTWFVMYESQYAQYNSNRFINFDIGLFHLIKASKYLQYHSRWNKLNEEVLKRTVGLKQTLFGLNMFQINTKIIIRWEGGDIYLLKIVDEKCLRCVIYRYQGRPQTFSRGGWGSVAVLNLPTK